MSTTERWLANHAVTELWSGWDNHAIAWTLVPQWSHFLQLENQQGLRIHVHYYGNSLAQEGDVWVDALDVGPVGPPANLVEPEWPHPAPPVVETEPVDPNYRPPTAPPIPPDHFPHIAATAQAIGIEPVVLAATAARESGFDDDAYREESELAYVQWRPAPGAPRERFPDGSLGACQILRSNFFNLGIDNDQDARDPANNYRVAAKIIRDNFAAFPDDRWKAVAAYNVGEYGARIGHVPADGYTDTILRWADEYRPLFEQPAPAGANGAGTSPASSAPSPDGATGIGERLIEYGKTLLGTPYVFGAKYPQRQKGIDCSGFVCEVLDHNGIHLGDRNYLSADAIRQKTQPIHEAEAREGDLIFFQNTYETPGASHIGFWVKPGQMLDAHGAGVQVTNIDTPFWRDHFMALGHLKQIDQ